jgi:hypothetical protein
MIEINLKYFSILKPSARLVITERALDSSKGAIIYFNKDENNQWISHFGPFNNKLINYLIEYGYITISDKNQVIQYDNIYCYLRLTPKALLEII